MHIFTTCTDLVVDYVIFSLKNCIIGINLKKKKNATPKPYDFVDNFYKVIMFITDKLHTLRLTVYDLIINFFIVFLLRNNQIN